MKTFIQTLGGMLQIGGVGFGILGLTHLLGSDLDNASIYGLMALGNTVVGLLLTELS